MSSLTVSNNSSTVSNKITVNFTTDVSNITNIELSKDGKNYISAISYTSSSAIFNVSDWDEGVYNNCTLRVTYKDSIDTQKIVIREIGNITVEEKQRFYISYSTNIAAIKHEFSWDGGNTFYDKTYEVISDDTNYKY